MYILNEQIMNGTVTLITTSTGVEAKTFKEAIDKVKNLPNFGKATIGTENDIEFSYYIDGKFPCYGRMENAELKVI